MEDSIRYEDRDQLYGALVKGLNLQKVEEVYYPEVMGNYHVTFSAKEFLIRYSNDRSQLFIHVASSSAPSLKWYYLSFIKNFINKTDKINTPDEHHFNLTSVMLLNDFLKNNFDKIAELLNKDNYKNTFNQIDTLLKQEFKINFPQALNE